MKNLEEKTERRISLEEKWEEVLEPYIKAAELSDGPFSAEDYMKRMTC